MQDAFGCAVENRFFNLLDDDSDPLDILHRASVEARHRKKKEEVAAAKKAGNQKSNKREPQKDRKLLIESSTDVPGQKLAPKQSLHKVIQNENNGAQVKTERAQRRTAFREFRPNVEKPLDYSIDNFEKEKLVRNWVANQRGGVRGRGGFSRNTDYENQRGKREFERHSGNDRTIKAEDKRGGSGSHNWGSIKDAFRFRVLHVNKDLFHSEAEAAPVENVVGESIDVTEEVQEVKIPEENAEDLTREMSLDEWKSMQDLNRPKAELKIRKPECAVPSKAVVIHKSKFTNNLKDYEEDCQYGLRKPVNDITFQLDINFGSLPRPGRGGRGGGGGRGRVRREEAFVHEMIDVHEFILNPDDPEDFPALS
ncbi:intracellular hyaluronan-binding protein 4 isoform X2 [Pseudophryne corroboree]|uniref:intracellular hyaluronan-binding protein 4 isoform X2 n=1 Tax=Pseudophryne corroboree TaxID=495146 RepID=UPI0030813389